MKEINGQCYITGVRATTLRLFEQHVRPGYDMKQTAERQLDGSYNVPLAEDVAQGFEARRSPGQSDDELLREILTHGKA